MVIPAQGCHPRGSGGGNPRGQCRPLGPRSQFMCAPPARFRSHHGAMAPPAASPTLT